MIAVATAFLGRAAFRLVRMVREPMVIAFATSSSEAALPKLIEGLTSSASKSGPPGSCCRWDIHSTLTVP